MRLLYIGMRPEGMITYRVGIKMKAKLTASLFLLFWISTSHAGSLCVEPIHIKYVGKDDLPVWGGKHKFGRFELTNNANGVVKFPLVQAGPYIVFYQRNIYLEAKEPNGGWHRTGTILEELTPADLEIEVQPKASMNFYVSHGVFSATSLGGSKIRLVVTSEKGCVYYSNEFKVDANSN